MNGLGILGALLGGALSVRPKRSFGAMDFLMGGRGSLLNASTIATVATAAWGLNELFNRRPPQSVTIAPDFPPASSTVSAPSVGTRPSVPPPDARALSTPPEPAAEPVLSRDMLRLVRLTIAATLCDGTISDAERARLMADAKTAKIEKLVSRELMNPRSIDEIVDAPVDDAHKRDLYSLAFCVVRADEGVNDRERAWLDELAAKLELDRATRDELERVATTHIDRVSDA